MHVHNTSLVASRCLTCSGILKSGENRWGDAYLSCWAQSGKHAESMLNGWGLFRIQLEEGEVVVLLSHITFSTVVRALAWDMGDLGSVSLCLMGVLDLNRGLTPLKKVL